jgi:hypothetical protein
MSVKKNAPVCAGAQPWRVIVVGDTRVSGQGIATVPGSNKRYHVCSVEHGFHDAGELIVPKITEKLPHSDKGIP